MYGRSKRQRDDDNVKDGYDTDKDGYDTDKEAATSKKQASGSKSRGAKSTLVIRRDALEDDPWTEHIESNKVTCFGCKKIIKLHTKRPYETEHWDNHKQKCPQITLKQTIRTAKKARVNLVSIL